MDNAIFNQRQNSEKMKKKLSKHTMKLYKLESSFGS